jgi:DNA-directed RNA polymerase subunit RPC12/RpoP
MNVGFETEPRGVICPYCGSSETELFSLFGQQLLTAQYYCRACHTPFEYINADELPGTHVEEPRLLRSVSELLEKTKGNE